MAEQRIKILVVDDLQEKLLVYRTILELPDLEVVTAMSGPDALGQLLNNDFAVILLDVNMPGMDGYETAEMIRKRRRSAHTPIIFVTAYADEMHALKGYSYGAVDFVLSPVVPDVLRTKVRVFTDLHRLTQQVRDHAARQIAHSERERARLSAVLNRTTDLCIQANADGEVVQINPAGLALLGCADGATTPKTLREVGIGDAELAAAASDGVWFGDSILRAVNGEDVPVSQLMLAHMDDDRQVYSYSLIARDGRERRRTEEVRRHLAAIVESSDDAIISMTVDGVITSWNSSAERLFGYTAEQAVGQPVTMLIPPERQSEEEAILSEIRSGRRVVPLETVRLAKDGRRIDTSLTVSPLFDAEGHVVGASKIVHDITLRKQNEAELVQHRLHLEDLVRDRTAELERSHERLRLADRLASIGTLAAGLGHDMGNLLLPIRARIASLEMLDLSPAAVDHIQAIKTAGEYLKRLSQGLRLFALDPTESMSGSTTDLAAWWLDVEPFLRNALPKTTVLDASIPESLPPVRIPPHTFTQAVYNLVQNAGDCMGRSPNGLVSITAARTPQPDEVEIRVSDNGPGMTEEVRQRCMEPFFTTRTRGISTGLGLALVHGAVSNAKGSIEVESAPGQGTTFKIRLPAGPAPGQLSATRQLTGIGMIDLPDVRLGAYMASLLRSTGLEVQMGMHDDALTDETRIVVVLDSHPRFEEIISAIGNDRCWGGILLSSDPPASDKPNIVWLNMRPNPSQMRSALQSILSHMAAREQVVA